jgi:hypothetical protein
MKEAVEVIAIRIHAAQAQKQNRQIFSTKVFEEPPDVWNDDGFAAAYNEIKASGLKNVKKPAV